MSGLSQLQRTLGAFCIGGSIVMVVINAVAGNLAVVALLALLALWQWMFFDVLGEAVALRRRLSQTAVTLSFRPPSTLAGGAPTDDWNRQ